jgi:DNA-binding MarR family transcriptional regulator
MVTSRRLEELPDETPAASCARQILDTIPTVMRLLRVQMRREAGEAVSVPQFRVLAFIGRTDGASLSAVADFIGVAAATASTMVDRLVRRGLVTREADPAERRRVRLHLTAEGAALVGRAGARVRQSVSARLATLDPVELAALERGLGLLRLAFSAPLPDGAEP